MKDRVVLVTQPEFEKAESVFKGSESVVFQPAASDEVLLAEAVRASGARVAVVGVTHYSGELYSALAHNAGKGGALVIRYGLGTDSIERDMLRKHGVLLANTPVDIYTSVAELTLFMIGALMRRLPQQDAGVRGGGFAAIGGGELSGKMAVIVGGGRIGLKVAAMLHQGFGVRNIVCDMLSESEWLERSGQTAEVLRSVYGVELFTQDLDYALRMGDIVTIHLPLTGETRGLFGAERLSCMKRGSVLVNAGRGGIVDEVALYDALTGGVVGGAALDVFEHEPYRPAEAGKDLRKLENTVMTPHCGSNTREANERMARSAVEQALSFLRGDRERVHLVE